MAKKLKYSFDIKKLCSPSMVYFVISAIALALVGLQNLNGDDNTLCLGLYKCSIVSKTMVLALNVLYILFWTFTLDLFCKAGYNELSWFIVLIPIILVFVFFGMIMVQAQI
mgnify:CR=1 FL=1|tara:strand:+ start:21 stop:353 length:333 start_codon:yes stop_codon:yes gene_type:complete